MVYQACPRSAGGHREDPGHTGGTLCQLDSEHLRTPPEELDSVALDKEVCVYLLRLPVTRNPDKLQMDGPQTVIYNGLFLENRTQSQTCRQGKA